MVGAIKPKEAFMRWLAAATVGQIIIVSTMVAPDVWRHPTPPRLILISLFGIGMTLFAILMVLFDIAERIEEAPKQFRAEEET
jgi:uncharacterized YccA/Bax inhibitor family protein